MTITQGFNIVDDALSLAVSNLEQRGMPRDEAHIALLIRLWKIVPDEVAEVAQMLRDDPELVAAISKEADVEKDQAAAAL